jgi:hypothetical protein
LAFSTNIASTLAKTTQQFIATPYATTVMFQVIGGRQVALAACNTSVALSGSTAISVRITLRDWLPDLRNANDLVALPPSCGRQRL